MDLTRRTLFKIAGVTVLGLSVKPVLDVFSQMKLPGPSPAPEAAAKRWAMAVDVKRCWSVEGCKDCIDACHRAHNVPTFPTPKEEIKWIWTVPFGTAFPDHDQDLIDQGAAEKPLVIMCNHCESPPCVRYCPTRATWQREDGIVMMDYHRCIGCRYCMAGCPYGSRSFNWRDPRPFIRKPNPDFPTRARGVVEKCNFCEERLAQGRLPACVEACKEKALIFGNVKDRESEIRGVLQGKHLLQRMPELGTKPKVYYIV